MAFFILLLLSAWDLDIGPEGFSSRDNISRGLMTIAIWKRPCINIFITYFARADKMLLLFTRGQITCYCPRKMLLPRRQITRRKLCFYYTCKFVIISIKYLIIYISTTRNCSPHGRLRGCGAQCNSLSNLECFVVCIAKTK